VRQSKFAASAPPCVCGTASDSAIVPGGDIGQNRKSATGRSVSIAPVSSVTMSSGEVSMPMSRWWRTICERDSPAGSRRGANDLRARHQSSTPVIVKPIPISASTPPVVSPGSPIHRWWCRSNIHSSTRSHFDDQRATIAPV